MKQTTRLATLPIFAGIALAFTTSAQAQDILAKWTFEGTPPADLANSTVFPSSGGIAANEGIFSALSLASGFHASNASDWTTPAGNGSAESISANTWAVGDYFQFTTSTVGYEDLTLVWDQTSSGTGPRDFELQYSTDGTVFTPVPSFDPYVVQVNGAPNVGWNPTTSSSVYTLTADLSAIPALDNLSTVYFRFTMDSTVSANGGVVATGGTSRVDNVTITAVPEPGSIAMALLGGSVLLARRRRLQS